jgi:hypothetical protein
MGPKIMTSLKVHLEASINISEVIKKKLEECKSDQILLRTMEEAMKQTMKWL